jgi:transcriptional regulator with XRE-family HTH domain
LTFRKDYLLYNMKKFIMKWVTFMRLRELRNKKGLTLKQLGSIIGVAESTVSLYEKGKRQPDNDTLIRIADYFGVSVDYLLGNSEEPADEAPEQGQNISAATQSAIVIKTLAKLKGITLKQLTESAGIGRNTISRMVQGHMPGIDVLTKIAEQLDCPVEMLLDIDTGEPDTPADQRVAEMTERMNNMTDEQLEQFYAVFRALIGKPIL